MRITGYLRNELGSYLRCDLYSHRRPVRCMVWDRRPVRTIDTANAEHSQHCENRNTIAIPACLFWLVVDHGMQCRLLQSKHSKSPKAIGDLSRANTLPFLLTDPSPLMGTAFSQQFMIKWVSSTDTLLLLEWRHN